MNVFGIKPTSLTDSSKIDFHTQVKKFEGGPTLHVQNLAKRPEIFHKTTTENGVKVLSQFNPDKAAPPPSVQLGFIKNVHDYFPKQTGPGYIKEGTDSGARYTEALKNIDPALFNVLGDAAWNSASVLPALLLLGNIGKMGKGMEFLKTAGNAVADDAVQVGAKTSPNVRQEIAERAADSANAQKALRGRLSTFRNDVEETMQLKKDLAGPVADAVRAADQRPHLVLKADTFENSLIPRYQDAVRFLQKGGNELPYSIRMHTGPMDLPQAQEMLSISTHQLAFTKQRINLIDKIFKKPEKNSLDNGPWIK